MVRAFCPKCGHFSFGHDPLIKIYCCYNASCEFVDIKKEFGQGLQENPFSRKNEERIVEDKEPIHEYFGLSYANYLVIPRLVLQSMPDWWQEQFVELLDQIPETIDEIIEPEGGYDVRARDAEGMFVEDPLSNYERGRRRLPLKNLKK